MGLDDFRPEDPVRIELREKFGADLVELADGTFPGLFDGDVAPKYRMEVVTRYVKSGWQPPRRKNGSEKLSVEHSKVLRLFNDVGNNYDRTQSDIRKTVLRMYGDDDIDERNKTRSIDAFIHDLEVVNEEYDFD